MITLGVIAYVVISLVISLNYTRTTYSLADGHNEGMETKEAFKWGFLTLPLIVLFMSLLFGLATLILYSITGIFIVCGWIITNMP